MVFFAVASFVQQLTFSFTESFPFRVDHQSSSMNTSWTNFNWWVFQTDRQTYQVRRSISRRSFLKFRFCHKMACFVFYMHWNLFNSVAGSLFYFVRIVSSSVGNVWWLECSSRSTFAAISAIETTELFSAEFAEDLLWSERDFVFC